MKELGGALLAGLAIYVLLTGLLNQGLISRNAYAVLLSISLVLIILSAVFKWVANFFRTGVTVTSALILLLLVALSRPELLSSAQGLLVGVVLVIVLGWILLKLLRLR